MTPASDNPRLGIALRILSGMLFAAMAICVKQILSHGMAGQAQPGGAAD